MNRTPNSATSGVRRRYLRVSFMGKGGSFQKSKAYKIGMGGESVRRTVVRDIGEVVESRTEGVGAPASRLPRSPGGTRGCAFAPSRVGLAPSPAGGGLGWGRR